ncbi:MAG: adenylate/guanylate cyclase domain-containing protein, partial [Robiginitalea sp.]
GIAQQRQQVADSLRPIYEADTLSGDAKMTLLENMSFNEITDLDLALAYAEELIKLARESGDNLYLYKGYQMNGHVELRRNDLDRALESYQAAMEVARQEDDKDGMILSLMYQGSVYADSGEPDRAISRFEQSSELLRDPDLQKEERGRYLLTTILTNLGYLYIQQDELVKAGKYLQEAGALLEDLNPDMGRSILPFVLGNQGMIYARLGDLTEAEEKLTRAIELLEQDGNYDPIAEYQITLAEVFWDEAKFSKAHDMAEEGLGHAERLGKKELISRASWVLAQLDIQSENYKEAVEHQVMYMQYKDSMDVETVDMSRYEREKAQLVAERAQAELELESQKRKQERAALWATGVTALLLIIVAVGSFGRYRYMRKTNKIISAERDRSEELLLNILPKETAQELKDNGNVLAKRFDSVTVLFTDFKGFTAHAESMDPEKLVESIDFYFSNFDGIVEKHGLEKIKTVGDAYMCASGLPFPSKDHAHRVAEAALELIGFVEDAKTMAPDGIIRFDIRVGINSGPVVAGVVGTKKFAYDIWGDTVNIASRMESASEIGRINIAEETFQLIKKDYECDPRGKLNMYFLRGRKAQSKIA